MTIKAVSATTWRRARLIAMERGVSMAAFVEGLIEREAGHASTR